ncbi:GNAT family N-acetyltransferase [Globicatella sanguinis]
MEKNYSIRNMRESEIRLLEDFLFEAFYVPHGAQPFSRDIIYKPEHVIYYKNFYSLKDDISFVAEVDKRIVGCVWVRVMNDYGHISDEYPSLNIAVHKEFHRRGIGYALMEAMINELKKRKYPGVSLSVQTENSATELYKKLGFEIYEDKGHEWIMLLRFVYPKD